VFTGFKGAFSGVVDEFCEPLGDFGFGFRETELEVIGNLNQSGRKRGDMDNFVAGVMYFLGFIEILFFTG